MEAADGGEAVRLYQSAKPQAALLDITRPDMDGLTALKEVRRLDPHAHVAMVTAMRQQAIVIKALKSGAREFVVKPFGGAGLL